MQTTKIEIAPKSVVITILIIIAFLLAWKIRFILVSLLAAYILMTGFATMADFFQSRGLGKTLSAILAYAISISFLGIVIFFIVPPLVLQLRDLVNHLPEHINRLSALYTNNQIPGVNSSQITELVTSRIGSLLTNVLSFLVNTVGVVINFVSIAVVSFYMLLGREDLKNNLYRLFPGMPKERVRTLADKIERQVGNWLKGQILLMFLIGVSIYIGLTLLGVDFALPLAIVAGLLEVVPVIGPILSAGLAILITVEISPLAAVGVGLLYVVVQQVESHIIVPNLMRNVIGLNPILTILAILIGANLLGLAGIFVAVPIGAALQVVFSEFFPNTEASKVQ